MRIWNVFGPSSDRDSMRSLWFLFLPVTDGVLVPGGESPSFAISHCSFLLLLLFPSTLSFQAGIFHFTSQYPSPSTHLHRSQETTVHHHDTVLYPVSCLSCPLERPWQGCLTVSPAPETEAGTHRHSVNICRMKAPDENE